MRRGRTDAGVDEDGVRIRRNDAGAASASVDGRTDVGADTDATDEMEQWLRS